MKRLQRLEITLTLLGPILTRGGEMTDPGLDAAVARAPDGRPMLPYSLVKGKVVDALRRLGRHQEPRVVAWFGRDNRNRQDETERGRAWFSDFVADRKGSDNGVIERIQMDAATGTAAGRMLAMLEAPFGYGEPVSFSGTVELVGDDAEIQDLQKELETAMRAVPAFGALKTVGFGRTKEVKIHPASVPATLSGTPGPGPILGVRWTPDRPFCFVGAKHSRNHFESFDFIPGAVLKGATARLILETCGLEARGQRGAEITPQTQTGGAFAKLVQYFEQIRFGEARPVSRDDANPPRPLVPPLSLVVIEPQGADKKVVDVALAAGPDLIEGAVPAFAPDWKDSDEGLVRTLFPWPEVRRERRTRTRINANTGRAADEQLFSYGLAMPDKLAWDGFIDLGGVNANDRPAVIKELTILYAHGLPNLGKTRAVAAVSWRDAPAPAQVSQRDLHVVTLQTDFLMTNPELLRNGSCLFDVYNDFWTEISGGALELETFFARQTLHGGYLAKRFRPNSPYEPYLVTDRGSVFVLEPTGVGDSLTLLKAWAGHGLPVPKWVETRYGKPGTPLWEMCPFLPQAGFGEVTVDLPIHASHQPGSAT